MPFATFAEEVNASVEDIGYPGAAVLVMHRGQVATMVDAGRRQVGSDAPITPETLFDIGSDTKPINSIVINMLVDEGLLDWEAPIQRYLPWFRVADPWISEHATLADLCMHRLGTTSRLLRLPRSASYSSRWRLEAFANLPQTGQFREDMQYANEGYEALALAAEAVTGQTMQSLVQQRLFEPLGMRTAITDRAALVRPDRLAPSIEMIAPGSRGNLDDYVFGSDVAPGHFRCDGDPDWKPCPAYFSGYGGSGVNLNMADAARYLDMLLRQGGDLIPDASFQRLIEPRGLLKYRLLHHGEDRTQHVATGFYTEHYRGAAMMVHSGSMPGFRSSIGFVPTLDLGFAIFQNARCADGTGEIFRPIMRRVIDRALGVPFHDHVADMDRRDRATLEFVAASNRYLDGKGPRPVPDPDLPSGLMAVESLFARYVGYGARDASVDIGSIQPLCGTYHDRGGIFGPATIRIDGDAAFLDFSWSHPLRLYPWADNLAIFQSRDLPQTMIGQVHFSGNYMSIDKIVFVRDGA